MPEADAPKPDPCRTPRAWQLRTMLVDLDRLTRIFTGGNGDCEMRMRVQRCARAAAVELYPELGGGGPFAYRPPTGPDPRKTP